MLDSHDTSSLTQNRHAALEALAAIEGAAAAAELSSIIKCG